MSQGLDPRGAFAVQWTGVLAVETCGTHWFKLAADDDASLTIDGQAAIDAAAPMGGDRTRGGRLTLACGLHPIRLRYVQQGGESRLRLSWATPDYREDWRGLPLFQPSASSRTIASVRWRREAPLLLACAWAFWLAVAWLWGLTRVASRVWNLLAPLRDAGPALHGVLLLGLLVFVTSISWGLPPWRPWGLDEAMPAEVRTALEMRFAGGWHEIYPPLHYLWLVLMQAPSLLFEDLGWLAPDDGAVTAARHVSARVLTVLLAGATLALVWLCAREARAPRAAAWAAAASISLPLVYYAKTVNLDVPSLFWLVASFLFFLRAVRSLTMRECCGLAITAACAVCSKDQTYGFYPGMALGLLVCVLRAPAASRRAQVKALAAGLLVFVVVFVLAQNLLFNLEGFRAHLQSITTTAGPGTYRMFPVTAGGMLSLAAATLRLIPWSMGWPLTIAAIVGCVLLIAPHPNPLPASGERGSEEAVLPASDFPPLPACGERVGVRGVSLLWLALPAVSYLLTFVAVVGYIYDRFLLGVLIVLALWAGVALERLANWRPGGRPVGLVAALLTVGVTILGYGASVNAAMTRDSRLSAEAWLRAHAVDDPIVVGIGGQEYLPNLHPWRFRLTSASAREALGWNAGFIVVNEPLARRLAADDNEPGALACLESGRTPYVRVFRERTQLPWFSLLRHTQWWRSDEEEPFTNLDKIGPTVSIWRLTGAADASHLACEAQH